MSFVLEYIGYPLENAPNLILVFYWVAYDCPWKFLFQSDPNVGTHVSIKSHEVEGPSKHMRFFEGGLQVGPSKHMRFLGPSKHRRFQEGNGPSKNSLTRQSSCLYHISSIKTILVALWCCFLKILKMFQMAINKISCFSIL